jgi:hypothetical protein
MHTLCRNLRPNIQYLMVTVNKRLNEFTATQEFIHVADNSSKSTTLKPATCSNNPSIPWYYTRFNSLLKSLYYQKTNPNSILYRSECSFNRSPRSLILPFNQPFSGVVLSLAPIREVSSSHSARNTVIPPQFCDCSHSPLADNETGNIPSPLPSNHLSFKISRF